MESRKALIATFAMVEPEQSASTFFNVGSRGYMMLPGLLAPSEVDSLAQQVDQYIALAY